ncbi:DUF2752 domain-containing protein [Cohnella suwonensis]|uniref:DUF2752 domain-containing protein n=1 Tax=Cohnella suwonensis TaxID=696072 RepID=A0ABW0LTD2_9BACL
MKAWLPATHVGIPCPFRLVTGLQCPGCGMTRAASSLLSLDAPQAFAYNPLPFVLAPLFLAYLFAKKRKANRTGNAIMAVMLAMTIAFGVLRNLPGWESWAS